MNENQTNNDGISDIQARPGRFWLWGLAVFQLLAVFALSCAGVGDTAVKACGFAILTLCGSLDIRALKKAGYEVPRWWWGLAVFLPPVYMVCRVLRTDKAPGERVKRFAPVLAWGLLLLLVAGSLMASVDRSDPLAVADAYLNALVEGDVDTVARMTGTDTSDAHAMRYLTRIVEDTSRAIRMENESIVESAVTSLDGDVAEVKYGVMDYKHTIRIRSLSLYRERGKWYVGEKEKDE